jgi:16S rRNA (guanine(966)-N(2))-methyltransferase RsmD
VREAIFSMLNERCVGKAVLDLFAGTGALGIEALSRGASRAVFVERRGAACQTIRANLQHTKLEDQAQILCLAVERALSTLHEQFPLIMLDHPYAYPNLHDIIARIAGADVLLDDTMVVFEHSPRFAVQERYGCLALQRQKVYGDTAVSIFVVQEEQNG